MKKIGAGSTCQKEWVKENNALHLGLVMVKLLTSYCCANDYLMCSVTIHEYWTTSVFKVPITPKIFLARNKSLYRTEQDSANIFSFG